MIFRAVRPPESESELLDRARSIAGHPLGDIARALGRSVPPTLRQAKGWVGQLLEAALGADANSHAGPDFVGLGVELKTLPVDARGAPLESTFLCTLSPDEMIRGRWEGSHARAKLARVLWLPVEGGRGIPISDRRVGSPLLWSPDPGEEQRLKADWERVATLVAEGYMDALTGHLGEVLQIRPKAARASERRFAIDPEGSESPALPRGFYLRTRFTRSILERHYLLPVRASGGRD